MSEIRTLMDKSIQTFKQDGAAMVIRKAARYTGSHIGNRQDKRRGRPEYTFADVLFINGCYLDAPSRYRVTHQREQLWAGDVSSNEVFYTELSIDMVRLYRVFVFFRCPYTDTVGAFIRRAKEHHKTVLYDIDDLMIDHSYTKTITHVSTMSAQERAIYDQGITLNQKTLKLCDGAITTTTRLAEELKKYVPKVLINRNVASEEMLRLSQEAVRNCKKQKGVVRIGYFSGNITHNEDLESILPALAKIMAIHKNVELVLAGSLDCPQALEKFQERVVSLPFADWKKLPEHIASTDINLAPLRQTVFNEAKSEIKWIEAALVKVPTIASNVGAFAEMIKHGVTGLLCHTQEEWEHSLEQLILDEALRKKIGNRAYAYCRRHCTSVYRASAFANNIRSMMTPNIAFILPTMQISGGGLVVLKHCTILKEAGYDVTIINQGDEQAKYVCRDGIKIHVIRYRDVTMAGYLDRAVATLWSTLHFFEEYSRIAQRYYNVQNFETDFYRAGNGFKIEANRTYCTKLPVKYITISKWCQKWLAEQYGKEAAYAPNGIECAQFYPTRRDWTNRKIRILVEGNSNDYYKNVDESFRITNLLDREKYEVWFLSYQGKPKAGYRVERFLHKVPYKDVADVYRNCDILLKSSLLESFSYPPLEMMATGGYVVAVPNGGNLEYLKDGENCLFYRHGNLQDAIHAIERIVSEEKLRNTLYRNGVRTARQRDWKNMTEEILGLYTNEW